ncbi:MAG: hypothetical protein FOGNACKC_00429 [Anaerolineae bacterium]|nr:hypothetical protein [Anaerolineae bacterium]
MTTTQPALTIRNRIIPDWAVILLLFGIAFVPRVLALDAYVATDEAKWILRSAHFFAALRSGDFSAAASQMATPDVEVLAPAVTTMWTGVAGLLAKHSIDGSQQPLNDFLAAMPAQNPALVSLGFYPWLRFPTVVITSLFVAAFYVLTGLLLNNKPVAFTATLLLALDPFFINYSRVIHHDALVTVFTVTSLLTFMVFLESGKAADTATEMGGTPPRPAALFSRAGWLVLSGVALGLALLTKPTALILLPVIGLMLLWRIYQHRQWHWLAWGMVWAGVGLLAFWLVWPALWQDPLGTLRRLVETSSTGAAGDSDRSLLPRLIPGRLPELGLLFYPVNFILSWGILPSVGLILLPFAWRRQRPAGATLFWLLLFSLLLLLALAPLSNRDIRYFMPAWPALMLLAAFGLSRLKWLKPGLVLLLSIILLLPYAPYYITYYNPLLLGPYTAPKLIKVGGGVGLNEAAQFLNNVSGPENPTVATYLPEAFRPYYAGSGVVEHKSGSHIDYVVNYIRQIQNQYPSAANLAYFAARRPAHTVRLNGIDYAYVYLEPEPLPVKAVDFNGISLVAQTLDARYAEPGRSHQLTLLWDAPATAASTEVNIELRDAAGKVWLASTGPLIDPAGPAAVEGHYRLDFPPGFPRGDYEVWVSVAGSDWAGVAPLPVRQLTPPERIARPVDANFNNWLALRGMEPGAQNPAPGQILTINLIWQVQQPIPADFTTFVHLVTAGGNTVAQADVIPGGGTWPTTGWSPGEWLTDTISLNLPADLPPGDYTLAIGMYRPDTGERLPLVGDTTGQNAVQIPGVTVK